MTTHFCTTKDGTHGLSFRRGVARVGIHIKRTVPDALPIMVVFKANSGHMYWGVGFL